MANNHLSRRGVLNGLGTAGLGVLTVGTGSAAAGDRGEYNVGTASSAAERAARKAADNVTRVLDWGDGEKTITGTFSEEAIERLDDRPGVRYTEVNGEMHAINQSLPWGIDRVDAEVAHANDSDQDSDGQNETGDGAHIAIIDTGIDDDHPDLQANVGEGKAFVECGTKVCSGPPCFTNNCNHSWSDDNDHGTHCAGIADAIDNSEGVVGVSTQATLHAVKVLGCGGCGSYSDVAAGIKHVADKGWEVGSMSLGGSKSSTVEDAVEYAYAMGVLLVAAAGNDGSCTDCVGYPAAEPEVIAVSATTESDDLADFSSQGPEVELAAPGDSIYSTVIGGYDTFSGTSMACPHVSGAGAQLMVNGYTNVDARDKLQASAEPLSGLSGNQQGAGLLDVANALDLDSSDDGSGSDDSAVNMDTHEATSVDSSSATLEGDLTNFHTDEAEVYFEWRESTVDDPTAWNQTSQQTLSSTGTFSEDITDLNSGTDYEFRGVTTAGDKGSVLSFTTDSSGDNPPAVDNLSLSEAETDDSDAEFDASWDVSDPDGDLDSVDLTLYELDSDGNRVEEEDSAAESASGDSASGTTRLVATGDDGTGNTYEVEAVVTDSNGNADSATATETESESTGDTAPTASIDGVSEVDSPSPHAEFDVSWSASDDDDDLDTAELTLYDDTDNQTEDSVSEDISGGSASGTTTLKAKFDEGSGNDYTAELVVTDSNGNTDSDTASFSENGS